MCHPEVPEGASKPEVNREEIVLGSSDGRPLPTLRVRPDRTPRGTVVVAADIFGRSAFYEDLAGRLAAAGFTALLPDLFFRLGPLAEPSREAAFARRAKLDDEQALRDLDAACSEASHTTGRVGTIGFCMGGTLVLQLAARRSDVATVCYYGFPAGTGTAASPIEVADAISGPILGFWGDQDAAVGMDNVERLMSALRARNVDAQHTIYPGLGHGFMAASRLDPTHEAYEAACDSWTRTIEFYRAQLV